MTLATVARADEQQFADLHTCTLQSGATIENCRIGYRTFGTLNEARDNIIILPSWFCGQSKDWRGMIGGADRLIDATRYYVIAIDAFGNDVSSSPSNSETQPNRSFPAFTMRDIVAAHYRVLHDVLSLDHVHAIIGVSMGGMQAWQWAVDYPTFVSRVVSIVGTPWPTDRDRLLWRAVGFPIPYTATFNRFNRYAQTAAMLALDIRDGDDVATVAKRITTPTLNVVNAHDHLVQPGPSVQMAQALGHPLLVLEGRCGHFAPVLCEKAPTFAALRVFLERRAGE